jgi:class 3 adenylate cyclase
MTGPFEGRPVSTTRRYRYLPPAAGTAAAKFLVAHPGTADEQRFCFYDALEVGRYEAGRTELPGHLLIDDPTVSFRHCLISQTPGGRCTVRDVSRNGTRLDGRRLVPNVEASFALGQSIEVAPGCSLILLGETAPAEAAREEGGRTMGAAGVTIATVLVGDIRDYTVLVRQAPAVELQRSVARLFERLTEEVVRQGGTVKEYQGDAVFAFWEGTLQGEQAVKACAAALALHRLAVELAADRGTWDVPGFPLRMEWALATGPVVIDSIGGTHQRAGLSMVGEAVVLAFRLEKFATDDTGPIVTCAMTRKMAGEAFRFHDLGEMHAKGFDRADRVFALVNAVHDGGAGSSPGDRP